MEDGVNVGTIACGKIEDSSLVQSIFDNKTLNKDN